LPNHAGEDDEKTSKSIGEHSNLNIYNQEINTCLARYQASMLRSLKEVQADDNVVGFYQTTTLGAFFNQSLIDTQAIHQDRLRHGGVVIVHGESALFNYHLIFAHTIT